MPATQHMPGSAVGGVDLHRPECRDPDLRGTLHPVTFAHGQRCLAHCRGQNEVAIGGVRIRFDRSPSITFGPSVEGVAGGARHVVRGEATLIHQHHGQAPVGLVPVRVGLDGLLQPETRSGEVTSVHRRYPERQRLALGGNRLSGEGDNDHQATGKRREHQRQFLSLTGALPLRV